jgi:hypothetical protein
VFDGADNYFKQLFAQAVPVPGLELQYGGLYVNRGEADEFLTYDDDGYLVGERATVRRPRELWLDEITVTRAAIGPASTPNLGKRWDGLSHPNYTQILGAKRVTPHLAASLEYDRQMTSDIVRAAVTVRLGKSAPLETIRYEQYWRNDDHPAAGFGIWADRAVVGRARVQGGYATVDQFYGGWNADRFQIGRRVFVIGTVPIYGPVSASIYATHALVSPYTVPVHNRFDAIISYDVLDTLRRARLF